MSDYGDIRRRLDDLSAVSSSSSSASVAATEATLALVKADVDKIPASPATDRTTVAAPFSVRLTDGEAFYNTTKSTQLPASLTSDGKLSVSNPTSLPLATDAAADSTVRRAAEIAQLRETEGLRMTLVSRSRETVNCGNRMDLIDRRGPGGR